MNMIMRTTPATTRPTMSPVFDELPAEFPEVAIVVVVVVLVVVVVGVFPLQSTFNASILSSKKTKQKDENDKIQKKM